MLHKTKSLRIPKEMAEAIAVVEKEEQIEESTPMRKLIRMGFETYVGNLYRDGRITLRARYGVGEAGQEETFRRKNPFVDEVALVK
jgi:hypothetical protein